MKVLLVVLMTLLLVTGGAGCMKTKYSGLTAQEKKMLKYVEKKYPKDSFRFHKSYGGVGNTYHCYVWSEANPDWPVEVSLTEMKSGDSFHDNYMAVKYQKEIEGAMNRILSSCYGSDLYLVWGPFTTPSPEYANSDTTYEEYAADPKNCLGFTAVVRYDLSAEGREKALERLKEAITKEGVRYGYIRIIFETDKDPSDFEKETKNERYGAYLSHKTYDDILEIEMEAPGKFTKITWEKDA